MKKKAKVSKYGQWQYPGEDTIIPNANGSITMKGVPYPVFGIDDLGNQQMMMPGGEYQFPGNSVYEVPMMAYGGDISVPDLRRVTINALPKAQTLGEFNTSYDASKSAAENLELNRRAQAAGWNSVDEYEKAGWGYKGYVKVPDVIRQQRIDKGIPADQIPEYEKVEEKKPVKNSSELQGILDKGQEASKKGEWEQLGYENKFYNYKNNPDFFDSHARLHDNSRANQWIKDRVYSGEWEYNPVTQETRKVKPENKADVSAETKTLAKDVRTWTKEEKLAHPESSIKNLPKSEIEKLRKEDAGFDQYVSNAEKEEGKRTVIAQNEAMVRNPAFYAPGAAFLGVEALPALWGAELLGTGLTVGNVANAGFIGQGIYNTLDPDSDMRRSWSKAYDNPNKSNLWDATLETGLNGLNFLGARALPGDLKAFGNAYNEIATGNSVIPYAWKSPAVGLSQEASAEMFNSLLNSGKITPAERALLVEYQFNSNPFTGRFSFIPSDLGKRNALNNIINKYELQFPQNSSAIATRRFNADKEVIGQVASSSKGTLGANVEGSRINFGDRPTSFSAGIGKPGYGGAPDRLVIPSRHFSKMKDNFIVNEYNPLSQEQLQLFEKPNVQEFASKIGTNPELAAERELIGTGLDFKQVGKVKNDIGGFDYIVRPRSVKAGTGAAAEGKTALQPQWIKPSETQLKQEFKIEHELKGHKYFASEAEFQRAVDEAKVEKITPEMDQAIQNKSRHNSREGIISSNMSYKSWPKYRNENTIDGIYEGMKSGAKMDMPIVLEFKDGTRRMFSGNTRMDIAFQSGKNPEALIVKVPESSAAGETLNAAQTSNIPENLAKQGIKSTHRELADLTDKLRQDRIKFWKSSTGKERLENVIENTPELKAAGITSDDYIRGIENMTVENRTAVNKLMRGRMIIDEQKALVKQLEEMKFLEQQTGMVHPDQSVMSKLEEKIASLDDELRAEMNDFYGLKVNSKYKDNAFMSRTDPSIQIDESGKINIQKTGVNKNTKFTTGVGPTYSLDDAERIINHEFGHLIQRGVMTNLDKELQGLDLLKTESSDLFSSANKKPSYFKDALDYFKGGSQGKEKLPFLEEVRSDMLQKGIIKDFGDPITEGMIRNHYANYMLEGRNHKGALRLYDIMKNNPGNFTLLQSVMNKMPVAIIGAGVGYGVMGGNEEEQSALPQKKRGGGIKNVDFIASRNKAILESLPKAQTGGGPKLNNNPDFEISFDISKSPQENMELNKRARQMGWNSVEEYKNSGWGQNKEGVERIQQSNRDRKRYTSWQGVTGPGEEPISQDEKTVLENNLKNVENWEKGWYSKRAMLPQFTAVAMERLGKINDQKTVPWGNTIYENQFPEFAGHYSASYNTVNIPRGNVDNESLLTHERSHWYDYNAPQLKDYHYDFYDDGKYKMPTYNKWYDPILKSIIPYEFSDFHAAHYRGFDPLQIPINANKQYDTEIEKILDADTPLPSTDDFNSLQDILKPFSSQDAHDYQYTPTEIRSRLNEWRKYHNIDPLKNYTNEEIQNIINQEVNDPNKPSWWNNMDLYKVVRGRGDLLKQLNDAYVSNGSRQSSDGVFRGKAGGQLSKFQLKGAVNKTDYSKPYSYLDSKTNTWLRPPENKDQNQMIDWSVNTPAFSYSPDSPYNKGKQAKRSSPEDAAKAKEYYRQEALKTPEGREEERKRLMQEFVDHENANKSSLQSSFGNLSLDNPATRDAASNYAGYKLGESSPMWATDRLLTGHNEPTTRDFYRPHESTLSFGIPAAAASAVSLGAGAAEIQPLVQGFNNLMSKEVTLGNTPVSVNSLAKAKGTYDLLTNTAPEAYNSFKTYSQTGNTNDLLNGLEKTGQLAIEGFSSFGPAKSTVKQIGKYYGVGQNVNDAYNAETTGQFTGSSYNAGKGAYNIIRGKKNGGELYKAQSEGELDYFTKSKKLNNERRRIADMRNQIIPIAISHDATSDNRPFHVRLPEGQPYCTTRACEAEREAGFPIKQVASGYKLMREATPENGWYPTSYDQLLPGDMAQVVRNSGFGHTMISTGDASNMPEAWRGDAAPNQKGFYWDNGSGSDFQFASPKSENQLAGWMDNVKKMNYYTYKGNLPQYEKEYSSAVNNYLHDTSEGDYGPMAPIDAIPHKQKGGSSYEIQPIPYRAPNISRQDGREYYDPMTETIYLQPSYPNYGYEQAVKNHEKAHHMQKLKGKYSTTELWPGPLKEPVIGSTDDMIFPYYNRTTEDAYGLMNSVPKSTLFGIPEDIAVMGFQNKTYDTPGTAEYEAEQMIRKKKKGGAMKRVTIKSLPKNWKTK